MKVAHIAGVKRTAGEGMRVECHCANALAVARYLEGVPCVKRVLYPGLESSPYHELVKTQMNGLGTGILSFELADDVNGVGPRPEAPHYRMSGAAPWQVMAPSSGAASCGSTRLPRRTHSR